MGLLKSGGGVPGPTDLAYRSGWFGIDLPTVGNLPSELSATSGAAPSATSTDQTGTLLTSGDAAGEQAFLAYFDDASLNNATKILLGVLLYHEGDFGAATTDFPLIGLLDETNPDNGDADIAAFVTGTGDNAAGNVRVDNNGTDTDGTFNFSSALNDLVYLELVIDVGTEVRFRENKSEIGGSPADVTVAAAPRIGQGRSLGVGIMGANNSTVRVAHFRSAVHLLP